MATAAHAHKLANVVHELKVCHEHVTTLEALVAVWARVPLLCMLQHVRATRSSRLEPSIALGARKLPRPVRARVLGQPSKTRVPAPAHMLANFLMLHKVMLLCEATPTRASKGTSVRARMSKIPIPRAAALATRTPIAPLPVYIPSHAHRSMATLQAHAHTLASFFHENEIFYSSTAGRAGDRSPRLRRPRMMS